MKIAKVFVAWCELFVKQASYAVFDRFYFCLPAGSYFGTCFTDTRVYGRASNKYTRIARISLIARRRAA